MPGDAEPTLKISVTQIKQYLRCSRAYELRYVRGVAPAFLPVPLAFGSAIHAALAAFYGLTRATGAVPGLERLQQVFTDAWTKASTGPVPLQVDQDDDDKLGEQLDKGIAMLGIFYEYAVAQPLPVVDLIEHGFTVDVHDPDTGEVLEEKLTGVIDLVLQEDGHRVICEHKSSARKFSLDQLRYDIQPTAYAFAAEAQGWGEVGLRYQILTKTKKPALQVEEIHRDEQDREDFLRTVVGVLRAIDCGAFFPVRGWQCKGCQYGHACNRRSS
jgi:putative RecB family exonuclease